jgi:hypothetical protein
MRHHIVWSVFYFYWSPKMFENLPEVIVTSMQLKLCIPRRNDGTYLSQLSDDSWVYSDQCQYTCASRLQTDDASASEVIALKILWASKVTNGGGPSLFQDRPTIPTFAWTDWGKPPNASVRIFGRSSEIKTVYYPIQVHHITPIPISHWVHQQNTAIRHGDIGPVVCFASDLPPKRSLPSWLYYTTRNIFLHTTILKQIISHAKKSKDYEAQLVSPDTSN